MSGTAPITPVDGTPVEPPAPQSCGLVFPDDAFAEMIAAAYGAYPLEACGLLVGVPAGATGNEIATVHRFVPCTNEAASAKVYAIPGTEVLRAERAAEDDGLEIVGVFHSHTHTEPYPSPTDVAQASDPTWHYVIVSLKRESPEARCYLLPTPGSQTGPAGNDHADAGPYDVGIREVPITVD